MVDKKVIDENINYSASVTRISNVIRENIIIHEDGKLQGDLLVKCGNNRATRAGENAEIHFADDPDGEKVPLRRLQDMGYNEKGEHLGYIADISYPNGTRIDFYNGTITDENGDVYPMGFYDNFRTDSQGNMNHITKGSANGLFKYQWQEMNNDDKRFVVELSSLVKRPSLMNTLHEITKDMGDISNVTSASAIQRGFDESTPLGKLMLAHRQVGFLNNQDVDWMNVDRQNLTVGQQVSKSDMTVRDFTRIHDSSNTFTETSVGFLNDKGLVVRDSVTGDSRSVNGKVNNWDNTYKIYTLITQADGTKGIYMGYPQNVQAGSWDNSGNPLNELDLLPNQKFEKVLVDKKKI